jgi:DNA polymerase III sliding clamp (beta) subunit (PCNA family)|tara:strand:+ start:68 stop:751 length:684 start_codon:yes stop_codon:yes gene_type:complete
MTNAQVKINPSYLKAAMICASTEGTRYYLNGVHFIITKDWVRLVATDGHRAFYYKDALEVTTRSAFPDNSLEVIVDLKDLKKALTGIKVNAGAIDVMFEKEHALINGVQCQYVDATYPDTTRIIPQSDYQPECYQKLNDQPFEIQLDAAYVGDFGKMAKLLGVSPSNVFIQKFGLNPAIVNFGKDQTCFALIMPKRLLDSAGAGIPFHTMHSIASTVVNKPQLREAS